MSATDLAEATDDAVLQALTSVNDALAQAQENIAAIVASISEPEATLVRPTSIDQLEEGDVVHTTADSPGRVVVSVEPRPAGENFHGAGWQINFDCGTSTTLPRLARVWKAVEA